MEIMVKSASCGTSESCLSISPYSISLAAEVFDCKCNSSKQVHSFAGEKKCIRMRDLTYKKTLRVVKHTAYRMEKTRPSNYNKSKLPANIFHTPRKFKVYWKQYILVPNPQM
jgi:hypothetical protein